MLVVFLVTRVIGVDHENENVLRLEHAYVNGTWPLILKANIAGSSIIT